MGIGVLLGYCFFLDNMELSMIDNSFRKLGDFILGEVTVFIFLGDL